MEKEQLGDKHLPLRVPIKLVAVLGLGLLVAVAIGSVLYIGFSVAKKNTDDLLSDKVEYAMDSISARVDTQLQPVESQAIEIARGFASGMLSLDDTVKLETYLAGVLSASPQVSAIAIARPDKTMMAMPRRDLKLHQGPWPQAKGIALLLQQMKNTKGSLWKPPIWAEELNQIITTLHMPLYNKGRFLGVLIQTVPVAELSRYLNEIPNIPGVPFIFYDSNKLIAHPRLINWRPLQGKDRKDGSPVVNVQAIGDPVLDNLLSAPGLEPQMLTGLKRSRGKVVQLGEREFILFTRPISRYGSEQWTLGLYLNTRTVGDTVQRLLLAFITGVGFLVLSVGLAMFAGSRFSRPIRSLATAMLQVGDGKINVVNELPRNPILEFDDAAQSFNKMLYGLRERDLIRQTLGRYVPEKVAESLLKENGALATEETIATVLFADIEGFTTLTENLGPEGIVALLNAYFSDMVAIIERHDGVVTQFQGDAILATFNVPIKNNRHAANALKAAIEMRDHFQSQSYAGQSLRTRIGVNTGHLIAGAVGAQGRLNYTVHGDAVNLAARIESLNKKYGTYILTTQPTLDQADGFTGEYVAETTVRGQSTPVKLYTLNSGAAEY